MLPGLRLHLRAAIVPWTFQIVSSFHSSSSFWIPSSPSSIQSATPFFVPPTFSSSSILSPSIDDSPLNYWQNRRTSKMARFMSHNNNSNNNNNNNESNDLYSMLSNKNLVSVQDCLDAKTISNQQQEQERSEGNVVFIDASWYHKGGRSGREEFEQGPRIAGAKYLDMDDIATTKELFPELNPKNLPHMLPTKELFAATMDAMQITNQDHIIIYAKKGCFFTPRTWFVFKTMGHDPSKIHLMQGSLEQWIDLGGDVETESKLNSVLWAKNLNLNLDSDSDSSNSNKYTANDPVNVYDMKQVLSSIQEPTKADQTLLLDPRGSSFAKGHMPNAIHVPYESLVNPDNSLQLKSIPELKEIFDNANVDINTDKTIICTCGSGVSVCHLMLALEECGRKIDYHDYDDDVDNDDDNETNVSGGVGGTVMYDGSWAEWGFDPDTPKVVS